MKPQFVLVRKLGGGAFGEVYLVRARDSKQLLAAKHQRLRSGDQVARGWAVVTNSLDVISCRSDTSDARWTSWRGCGTPPSWHWWTTSSPGWSASS